jgi:gentisate 1,2-dioxygenase
MEGAEGTTGAYVLEIAPGKHTSPQRHLYEDLIFVLKGRGATTIWNDKGAKQTFEWQDGSLFALPLNSWYQHFNGGRVSAIFSVNSMPIVFNLFITPTSSSARRVISDRFNGETESL